VIGAEWIRVRLPPAWRVARIRDTTEIINGFPFDSKTFSDGIGHPLVRIRDIFLDDTNVYVDAPEVPDATIDTGDILVGMDGDFNVARWRGGRAQLNQRVCCIRPHKEIDTRFLSYLLPVPLKLINEFTYSTTVKHLSSFDIQKVHFPCPDFETQRQIADFLDLTTGEIDTLIEAKMKLLGLLAEKRQTLVAEAVMRGLNRSAPLRPSGIDWLGDIPAHWEVRRSKWLFEERDVRSTTGEETLYSLRMERGLVPHNDVSEKKTLPEELVGYKIARQGELVVNRMRAATGLIAIAPEYGLVSPDYAVFVPSTDIECDYYVELFKTTLLQAVFRSESTGLGTGSQGFLRLYSQNFLALWFPYPPIEEQRQILEHLNVERAKIDKLATATERSIALLKERRSALIAAAVTGQIEIPEAA